MTPEQINAAITAELGIKPLDSHRFEGKDENRYFECMDCGETVIWSVHKGAKFKFPEGPCRNSKEDYCGDLNAMHEAESQLDTRDRLRKSGYADTLYQLSGHPLEGGNRWYLLHATPRQRAEAFLRTIGKWVESSSPLNCGSAAGGESQTHSGGEEK